MRANELIRTALTPYRDGLVIAAKVGPLPGPNGVPSGQATAGQLRGLVEARHRVGLASVGGRGRTRHRSPEPQIDVSPAHVPVG